jgi:hypothetical protein
VHAIRELHFSKANPATKSRTNNETEPIETTGGFAGNTLAGSRVNIKVGGPAAAINDGADPAAQTGLLHADGRDLGAALGRGFFRCSASDAQLCSTLNIVVQAGRRTQGERPSRCGRGTGKA